MPASGNEKRSRLKYRHRDPMIQLQMDYFAISYRRVVTGGRGYGLDGEGAVAESRLQTTKGSLAAKDSASQTPGQKAWQIQFAGRPPPCLATRPHHLFVSPFSLRPRLIPRLTFGVYLSRECACSGNLPGPILHTFGREIAPQHIGASQWPRNR